MSNGNVKTRLASTIGSDDAIDVYNQLLDITESATKTLKVDRQIIYSDCIEDARWTSDVKGVQQGKDLGERMKNAFRDGFSNGYDQLDFDWFGFARYFTRTHRRSLCKAGK